MRWIDRVYGEAAIRDQRILRLIACPTYQRLKGIRQAGPSALAFPFKNVTRYEHCLGVYLLLQRLGAPLREQTAGLLHDISHTAFSHAVDFVLPSAEQDHHEALKPVFLQRPDMVAALDGLGFRPEEFYDDSIYPLLERPLPWLCADRLDYFFRDSLACGVTNPEIVRELLAKLAVRDGVIVFTDPETTREAVRLFAAMNRDWWASPTEAYIYNEFAEALKEGMRIGVLTEDDLLQDDAHVLRKLRASRSSAILDTIQRISRFREECIEGYVPRVIPKQRWLDPPVQIGETWARFSELPLASLGAAT